MWRLLLLLLLLLLVFYLTVVAHSASAVIIRASELVRRGDGCHHQLTECKPHLQHRQGSGRYPASYDLHFPAHATGDSAVMFFGRIGSGKSRLIERILDLEPGAISSASYRAESFTVEGNFYFISDRYDPNLKLYCGHSVGFTNWPESGRRLVLTSIASLVTAARAAPLPVKRLYYVIDVSCRRGLCELAGHLSILNETLGSAAASQICFLLNRCDVIHPQDQQFFDEYARSVRDIFHQVFPEQQQQRTPDVLFVSCKECVGQLLDDIVESHDRPAIVFDPDDHVYIYLYLPDLIHQFDQRIAQLESDHADVEVELEQAQNRKYEYLSYLTECWIRERILLKKRDRIEATINILHEFQTPCDISGIYPNHVVEWDQLHQIVEHHDPGSILDVILRIKQEGQRRRLTFSWKDSAAVIGEALRQTAPEMEVIARFRAINLTKMMFAIVRNRGRDLFQGRLQHEASVLSACIDDFGQLARRIYQRVYAIAFTRDLSRLDLLLKDIRTLERVANDFLLPRIRTLWERLQKAHEEQQTIQNRLRAQRAKRQTTNTLLSSQQRQIREALVLVVIQAAVFSEKAELITNLTGQIQTEWACRQVCVAVWDQIDRRLGGDGGQPTEFDSDEAPISDDLEWAVQRIRDAVAGIESLPDTTEERAAVFSNELRSEIVGRLMTQPTA